MLLVVDVGNTNIVFGMYEENVLVGSFRMATQGERTSDEMGLLLTQYLSNNRFYVHSIEGVIISSVVPPIMHALENCIRKFIKKVPIIVNGNTDLDIKISMENPQEVGADRLVNAYSALESYKNENLIIVDFGTATTFCAVSKNREYLGGVICAGIKISMDALFNKASKLPRVEIAKPKNVIGKNTVEAMQVGAVYGYVGQVDYIVNKMKAELEHPKVIATGGLAKLIAEESDTIEIVNNALTLEGLRFIFEKVVKNKL